MTFEENYQLYVDTIEKELEKLLDYGAEPSRAQDAMRYALLGGGKRIRGVLTLEFCRVFGGKIEDALPAACAIEMVHAFSLIHDDLPCMDNDDFRRGKPSCHKAFGEAVALLAGNALMALAFGTLDDINAVKVLARYTAEMIEGQGLDILYIEQKPTKADIIAMYEKKTCALLQAACQMSGENEAASRYARNLGLAFQFVDDVLDGEGCENADADAEKYTQKTLEALELIPNNEFLVQLTKNLLHRSN